MMNKQTIFDTSTSQLIEKNSKFLGFLVPISEFERTLHTLKMEHRKANHHVTAFRRVTHDDRIEEGANDDGEPSGTSAMPILKVMTGANLVDCAVVVVRYFGGTKLGTGGLARAYSGTAKLVIDNAELKPWNKIIRGTVTGSFADMSILEERIANYHLKLIERSFTESGVVLVLEGPEQFVNSISPTEPVDCN